LTIAFVNKSFEYASQNPTIVPSFLDLAEFVRDSAAVPSLKRILRPLEQLNENYRIPYMAAPVFYNAV